MSFFSVLVLVTCVFFSVNLENLIRFVGCSKNQCLSSLTFLFSFSFILVLLYYFPLLYMDLICFSFSSLKIEA